MRSIGEHAANLLTHQDDHIRLRDRTIAGQPHQGWEDLMLGALSRLKAQPRAFYEFTESAAEPGDRDLPVRAERCQQLRPLALIAI